jgi:uncharacterized protein (TIGR02284 family)
MNTSHDISVLNNLTKTTLDSYKGFKDAAEDAEAGGYASMFSEFASERSRVASMLQEEVRHLGGEPEDDSSVLAAAHRAFMNVKQTLMGHNDRAIIEEVERGEDYIKEKYQEALRDDELSPEARTVIEQAFTSVRQGHDRVSALKHSLH